MLWRYVLLFIAVISSSLSVILIRMSPTNPIVLSAFRLLVASVLLFPVFWLEWKKHRGGFTRQHWLRTLPPSLLLAVHFASWAFGARLTSAAQASLIVNLVPVAMPFLLHWLVNERINRIEVTGTVIAIGGIILVTAPGAFAGGGDFIGNAICFGSMLLVAGYVALGRRNRDFPSLWLYVIPIYFQAGLICLAASIPWLGKFGLGTTQDWIWIFALACIPTITGHTLLNYSVRHLRGQLVGLAFAAQFIFPTIIAYFLFHERPASLFYAASVIVLAGIALVVFSAPTPPPPAVE
ncbi:MAG: putative rane protein [Verrucomicrobia bacterium]|nr:putative rane protein [Verrucomicrobiota bacterium]